MEGIDEREEILKQVLTPAAYDYLNFIKNARPQIYGIIRNDIYTHYKNGNIRGEIGVEKIKHIVNMVIKEVKKRRINTFARVVT